MAFFTLFVVEIDFGFSQVENFECVDRKMERLQFFKNLNVSDELRKQLGSLYSFGYNFVDSFPS